VFSSVTEPLLKCTTASIDVSNNDVDHGGADTVTDFELGIDHLRLDDDLTVKSVEEYDLVHA
jgi:hypothetical protein